MAYAIEMLHIEKSFGGVAALKGVEFKVKAGRVHALLGENGAGKSTLMKILMGVEHPDSGSIYIKEKERTINQPRAAAELGLSMIYQEFNSISSMTVADNFFLGREVLFKTGIVNHRKMITETENALRNLGVSIPANVNISTLSVAQCQLVEIVKAVSFQSDIIIMDEPTSALSDKEIANLFRIIRELKNKGTTIVYISHKLEEIFEICDEVTVLRDGNNVGTANIKEINENKLVSLMVGREIKEMYPKIKVEKGEPLLEVSNLTRHGEFTNIKFQLFKGEILGFAGLMGAGRSEIAETIFGIRKPDSGEIFFKNKKTQFNIPRDAILRGISLVPEDRKNTGLILCLPVRDNLVLSALQKVTKRGVIRKKEESRSIQALITRLQVKVSSFLQVVSSLSGGNQQKVVIGRCLFSDPDLIILDEPTRGIDVKTKSEIHRLMSQLASEGKGVIMISSELPEIIGMSDRVIVLHEGKITGELSREQLTPERIMELAIQD